MWDKKRPEPTPAAPPPSGPASAGSNYVPSAAASPAPAARPPEPLRAGATIGKAVKIIGDVTSDEDLFLDGEIQGSLLAKNSRLTIGPNGRAKSDLVAREIIIQGQVQGNCDASQKITIRKEGSLVGNIKTTGIIIEDDAYFKGSIDIVRTTEAAKA
jgi:cytoskeletal protein CcmA (bactofilin family)